MAAVSIGAPQLGRVFYPVTADSQHMEKLTEIFDRILTPLYGSQQDALSKIAKGKDRTCYLLYENEQPVGVIAFKTVLSDEFAEYGVKNSVEIKSLFVVDSSQNSGRGVGSTLLNELIRRVSELHLAHQESFHVTVSETKRESLIFFLKKGFQIKHSWYGKYNENVIEHLLACPARVEAVARDILGVRPRIYQVDSAHWDDIHALRKLSDGSFISGSKDHSLYKWDYQGQLIAAVREVEPTEIDSRSWVTALSILNGAYFASAERSGRVCLWTTKGRYVKDLNLSMPSVYHVSKQENKQRVNCLAPSPDPEQPGFFVGFPTCFAEYNAIEAKTLSSTRVHSNDWVYCLHPLTPSKLLAVVGGSLHAYQKEATRWNLKGTLIAETKKKGKQRDFISSLTQPSESCIAAASFYGSVRVVDLTQGQSVASRQVARDKLWSVESLSPHAIASGGEDKTVRLWDIRSQQAPQEWPALRGSVSALLKLEEHLLVAGSCPAESIKNGGAALTFYDIRKGALQTA